MKDLIQKKYGNRVRLRACGVCIQTDSILLVKHIGLGSKGIYWSPPGGSVEYGEELESTIKREFMEETGLEVEVGKFLFINEFIDSPLHALEVFFEVRIIGGQLRTGSDPELSKTTQIISEVRFVTFEELKVMDANIVHNALRDMTDRQSLLNMNGHIKFCK